MMRPDPWDEAADCKVCLHCGNAEEDHCKFEPIPKRPGCVCETMSWGNPSDVPPVCAAFLPMSEREQTYCKNCEHDEGCHNTPGKVP